MSGAYVAAPTVSVLGPVELRGPVGPVAVQGLLPRGLLALLAVNAGRAVPLDRICEHLWDDRSPRDPRAAVQQLASRVRRSLNGAGLAGSLTSTPGGYVLAVEPVATDLGRFRHGARLARQAWRADDPARTARHAGEALGWWRGPALVDLVDLPLAVRLGPGLDDERWRLAELRAEALLAGGDLDDALVHLAEAVAAEPLREQLWVLYARALASAGRPAESIQCARRGAAVLSAELGVPPCAELGTLTRGGALETEVAPAGNGRPTQAPAPRSALPAAQHRMLLAALDRAVGNAERAARAAMARGAHDEAVQHWTRALDAVSAAPGDGAVRLRVLLGLSAAHRGAGRFADADGPCREAAALARELHDPTGLGQAALVFCGDRVLFDPPAEREHLLREALERVGSDDLVLSSRLLGALAKEGYWTRPMSDTRDLANRAWHLAVASGDTESRLRARQAQLYGTWAPDLAGEHLAFAEAYLVEAVAAGDRYHEQQARRWLVPVLCEHGEVARGGEESRAALSLADEIGLSLQQWLSHTIAAAHAILVGDLVRAQRLVDEGLALGVVAEPEVALDLSGMLLWNLRWLQGRLAEIDPLVREMADGPGVDTARRAGVALTHAELGRHREAAAVLDTITAADLAGAGNRAAWSVAAPFVAVAAARCGHRAAAALARAQLTPVADRIGVTNVTATGPMAYHLGLACWTLGDECAAAHHLVNAIGAADDLGLIVFGAHARVDLAALLAAEGRLSAAREHAAIAAMVSEAHDLQSVAARAGALLCATS